MIKKRPSFRKSERGQALAETALFSIVGVMMAFMLLSYIPIHRTKTAAIASAYACAQFLSQSPDPARATKNANAVAWRTLNSTWSGTRGANFRVRVVPPSVPGSPGTCYVDYFAPTYFRGLLGGDKGAWQTEMAISRSETWKAKWK